MNTNMTAQAPVMAVPVEDFSSRSSTVNGVIRRVTAYLRDNPGVSKRAFSIVTGFVVLTFLTVVFAWMAAVTLFVAANQDIRNKSGGELACNVIGGVTFALSTLLVIFASMVVHIGWDYTPKTPMPVAKSGPAMSRSSDQAMSRTSDQAMSRSSDQAMSPMVQMTQMAPKSAMDDNFADLLDR